MPNLGTRDDWRKTKEKYGIPDGVCKFSMGEKLGAFAKAEAAAKDDAHARAELWENMVTTVETYQKALNAMKPDKFKGKTPSEKQANFGKAKTEIAAMLARAKNARDMVTMQAKPLQHVKTYLGQTISGFKSLDRNDKGALQHFYGQDLRNTLGLAIRSALKDGLRPDIKQAFTQYETYMDQIDSPFNHGDTDLKEIYTAMGKALQVLHATDL